MSEMSDETASRRDQILGTVEDLVANFMYYDRKNDEDLPAGVIEEALAAGEVTLDELTAVFRATIDANL